MKTTNKILVLITLMVIALIGKVNAQPQSLSYQAEVRNDDGTILSNQNVALKFEILNGSTEANSTVLFSERQVGSTDQYGLFTCNIGKGGSLSGTFSTINWSKTGNYYLRVSLDATGGNTYELMGSTQLVSVPFALQAGNAKTVDNVEWNQITFKPNNIVTDSVTPESGDILYYNGNNWISIPKGGENQVLTMSSNVPTWKNNVPTTTYKVGDTTSNGDIVFWTNNTGTKCMVITKEDINSGTDMPLMTAASITVSNNGVNGKVNTDILKAKVSYLNTGMNYIIANYNTYWIPSQTEWRLIYESCMTIGDQINLDYNANYATSSTEDISGNVYLIVTRAGTFTQSGATNRNTMDHTFRYRMIKML